MRLLLQNGSERSLNLVNRITGVCCEVSSDSGYHGADPAAGCLPLLL